MRENLSPTGYRKLKKRIGTCFFYLIQDNEFGIENELRKRLECVLSDTELAYLTEYNSGNDMCTIAYDHDTDFPNVSRVLYKAYSKLLLFIEINSELILQLIAEKNGTVDCDINDLI